MRSTIPPILAAACLAAFAGCGSDDDGSGLPRAERDLRSSLGIPLDAERVLVVSQSSHMDLNFLFTFDGYYENNIRHVIRRSLDLLDQHPRYRYSIAEIGFLRRYWDENPGERERILRHTASGALEIVGGGLSSPDTVLPTGESLVRDYLRGVTWMRQNLGLDPTAAWLPDSFGHSPELPSILEHVGIDAVGFFRIDGGLSLPVPATEPGIPTTPGSTAEQLSLAGTADFRWSSRDGARVLARWMPYGYGQGDDIGLSSGAISFVSAIGIDFNQDPFLDPENANDQIENHADNLSVFQRGAYAFLPIGIDFAYPKGDLLAYLDRWNAERYPETGVWAHPGTLVDHAALIESREEVAPEEAPELAVDPNPYWTGFYTTQPQLKSRVRRGNEALTAAEKIASVAGTAGGVYPWEPLDRGWDLSAFMNHHDAITGTARVDVIAVDLDPWSIESEERGEEALAASLASLAAVVNTSGVTGSTGVVLFNPSGHARSEVVEVEVPLPTGADPATAVVTDLDGLGVRVQTLDGAAPGRARLLVLPGPVPPMGHAVLGVEFGSGSNAEEGVRLTLRDGDGPTGDPASATTATLANGRLTVVLERARGWCLTSVRTDEGLELISGPSNDVVTYRDDGGAYRIGSEIDQTFEEIARTCGGPATLEVIEAGALRTALRITPLDPADETVRIVRLDAGARRVDFETTVRPPFRTSIVARFRTPWSGSTVVTSIPFGAVERPRRKLFEPTFWPAIAWVDVGSIWMSAEGTRGWNAAPDGTVEPMLARNTGWDFLGPDGRNFDLHTIRYSLGPEDGGPVRRSAMAPLRPLRATTTTRHPGALPPTGSWVQVDDPDVEIVTLKRAVDRSGDLILRLVHHGEVPSVVRVETALAGEPRSANGLEDPGAVLGESASSFEVSMERSVVTVRIGGGDP